MRYGLVADIGGTNARFALVDLDITAALVLLEQRTLKCADYPNIEDAIGDFLQSSGIDRTSIYQASIAVAGVISGDEFKMTNNHWQFSITTLTQQLELDKIWLINDFAAVAWSLSALSHDDWVAIGGGHDKVNTTTAVMGPGTGLGVAACIPTVEGLQVLETEGGHVGFAPNNDQEIAILQYLLQSYPRVSAERLLSGGGLENIYTALADISGIKVCTRTAADITHAALQEEDKFCVSVLNQFCEILGSVAGDVALGYGAYGGVYIGGGIAPRIIDFLQESNFRRRFEEKGRFSATNADIVTRVIVAEEPGLLGVAVHGRKVSA